MHWNNVGAPNNSYSLLLNISNEEIKTGLLVKALDSRSNGLVFKTTEWLQGLSQLFILTRLIKWVPGIFGNLVLKSKQPPRSGSVALR